MLKLYRRCLLSLSVITFIAVLPNLANADDDATVSPNLLGKGFYWGLDAGLTDTSLAVESHNIIFNSNTALSNIDSLNQTLSSTEPTAGVIIGYGETSGDWYAGGELGLEYNHAELNSTSYLDNQVSYENKANINNYITLDLMPGYFLTPNSLVYGRLGGSAGQIDFANYQAGVQQVSDRNSLWGLRTGVGYEYSLTNNIAAGIDYVHTFYLNDNEFTATNDFTTYDTRPSLDTVTLRFIYNFGEYPT